MPFSCLNLQSAGITGVSHCTGPGKAILKLKFDFGKAVKCFKFKTLDTMK
uniref:Macaca fascicularis brain cDNA clone: QmoA-11187, similar to human hypothetical protein LOC339476 (LOC339476), mRNA, RefSeq: XM_378923.1 n=1 Tax=Macaca fascicularis TaxID=9541 RepID=I7GE58_MACFA|nr:unnamed protein product [Macaca fascicularis]